MASRISLRLLMPLIMGLSGPVLASTQYAIKDLGVDSRAAIAGAINDAGEAAFWLAAQEFGGDPYGFREQNIVFNGSFNSELPSLGGILNIAIDINNIGTVVGGSSEPDRPFFTQAVQYTSGTIHKLEIGSGFSSLAHAINDEGQIVGWAVFESTSSHAFLWNGPEDVIDLGTLGGTHSNATDINNNGVVVGNSELAPEFRFQNKAFVYRNGVLNVLDLFDAPSTFAHAINDSEQIVGAFTIGPIGDPEIHAFLLDPVTGPIDLGSAGLDSTAYDINELGTVVGNSERTPDSSERRAFVYDSVHGMRFLEDLISADSGWDKLHTARSINNRGQILGEGTINGELHVFLLTPIPEPASLILLLTAAVLSSAFCARRR